MRDICFIKVFLEPSFGGQGGFPLEGRELSFGGHACFPLEDTQAFILPTPLPQNQNVFQWNL